MQNGVILGARVKQAVLYSPSQQDSSASERSGACYLLLIDIETSLTFARGKILQIPREDEKRFGGKIRPAELSNGRGKQFSPNCVHHAAKSPRAKSRSPHMHGIELPAGKYSDKTSWFVYALPDYMT